jgi:hypothetical protein
MALAQVGRQLRGQPSQGREERAEPDPPAAQAAQLGELLLRARELPEDDVGVLDQQPAGLGGADAAACPLHELEADLALEQGPAATPRAG